MSQECPLEEDYQSIRSEVCSVASKMFHPNGFDNGCMRRHTSTNKQVGYTDIKARASTDHLDHIVEGVDKFNQPVLALE